LRLSKSWDIANKDFKVFLKKKNVTTSIFAFPLIISILLSYVVYYVVSVGGTGSITVLIGLLPSLTFYFAIIAAILPTTLASYSLVGEKVEKSLEPLLATPMTDDEILLGKGIAAFLPPMLATYLASIIFMVSTDVLTRNAFGFYFFPNLEAGVMFAVLTPLAAVMSVEVNVMISSRVSDVRVSQQLGFLAVFPMAGVYVGSELGLISLDPTSLLAVSAILALADLLLLFIVRTTFRRDEILTRWR
jgi:ABC-type Na+ efflux pump permease subunit